MLRMLRVKKKYKKMDEIQKILRQKPQNDRMMHRNLTLPLSKPLLNLPLTGTTYETFSL
jgi:hypothetical protein